MADQVQNLPAAEPAARPRGRKKSLLALTGVVVVLVAVGGGLWLTVFKPHPFSPKVAIAVPLSSSVAQDAAATPGTQVVSPTASIAFNIHRAQVKSVVVTSSTGQPVAGHFTQRGWTPSAALPLATTFHLTLKARGGYPMRTVVRNVSFSTPLPTMSLSYTVSPQSGSQVGMGTFWVIQFKAPIPANLQTAVIDRLKTTESIPDTVGWHWWTSTEVDGRPQNFWPLDEKETLNIDLDGMVMDGHQITGSNYSSNFEVVDQHLTKVSAITHQMQVYNGSQLVGTYPVSLGQPGFPTLSGTLVVLYKEPVVFMNSASIGYPGLYAQNVYDDVAISTDGYFMHAANWDVADHGVANVSYGCVEQNPNNAVWFYNFSKIGDVVETSGTPLAASEVEGEGDWNIPWSQFTVAAQHS